jgi:hypothetical protein
VRSAAKAPPVSADFGITVDEHITTLRAQECEFAQLDEFVKINDGFYRFRGMHVNITVMKDKLVIRDESHRQTGWNRGAWGDIGRFLRDMEARTPQVPPPSWVGHVHSTPGGGVRSLQMSKVHSSSDTQATERSAAARESKSPRESTQQVAAQRVPQLARNSSQPRAQGIPAQKTEKRTPGLQYRSISPLRVESAQSAHMFAIRDWRAAGQGDPRDQKRVQPPRPRK